MPPKKKKTPKKSTSTKAVSVLVKPIDTKLPTIQNPRTATLLSSVACHDSTTVERLVRSYGYQDCLPSVDINGSTGLHLSSKTGDIEMIRKLLNFPNPPPLNALEKKSIGGFSAIHHACYQNYPLILALLLEHGADPNIRADSAQGETPLMICCIKDHLECARILLSMKAHPDRRDNFGNNASFWANSKQNHHLVADLNLPPSKTASPLEFLNIMKSKIPGFTLPSIAKTKGGGGDSSKKKKKKK